MDDLRSSSSLSCCWRGAPWHAAIVSCYLLSQHSGHTADQGAPFPTILRCSVKWKCANSSNKRLQCLLLWTFKGEVFDRFYRTEKNPKLPDNIAKGKKKIVSIFMVLKYWLTGRTHTHTHSFLSSLCLNIIFQIHSSRFSYHPVMHALSLASCRHSIKALITHW